ncbi:hypothetical protein KY289_016690 [Solanum tuberosum]|nr:hypothetical protein KY289_016690 [Solanum tuberosum]
MGSIKEATKPHAVLLPYPSQGHVTPMMSLAKLLHSRGFHITFVNTEFNHSRLIQSKGVDSVKGLLDFKFATIPDGMPPSDENATQDITLLCDMTRKTCLVPFKKLLTKLNSGEVPPVSCVISDGVMTFGIKAAQDLGIPDVTFWTASVCAFVGYLHYRQLIKRGIFPFKNDNYLIDGTLDTPIDWIPGMKDVKLKDLPSFLRTTDPNDIMFDFMGEEAQNCLKASAIMFNTFEVFEHELLQTIVSNFNFSNIYSIGPLGPLLRKHVPHHSQVLLLNSSLWKPDTTIFEWLDNREIDSVLYVNYGSVTTMTNDHFLEFAWGLANSKQQFLWIVRQDIIKGESATLSEEFLEEIKDRGILVNWCAQEQVLRHPAVGAFLTHCGWNSMMETISEGVPVICWPFFSDQQTNCHYSCEKWGIGMEVNHDVKREEVAKLVSEMMEGEKGKEMRSKAREWKMKAEEATDVGGSSFQGFLKLVKAML